MTPVFDSFEERHKVLWQGFPVRLRHRLHELKFFDDTSLADLIDLAPSQMIHYSKKGTLEKAAQFSYCDRSGLSGKEVLKAVKKGRLWVNLMKLQEADRRYADLLDWIYEDLSARLSGFKPVRRNLGLLISSPHAMVYFHCDLPDQCLWQIRGEKRVWIYPNREPFLNRNGLENLARGITEEVMPYEAWFNDYAIQFKLEPGDMLHWPVHSPHRVENLDSLNVSITTGHWTFETRRSFAVNYANGLLRSKFGHAPRSQQITGPVFWTKAGLALAWRRMGLERRERFKRSFVFKLDPEAEMGVRPLDPAS